MQKAGRLWEVQAELSRLGWATGCGSGAKSGGLGNVDEVVI